MHQATLEGASSLQKPNTFPFDSTHTFPKSIDFPRQSIVLDTNLSEAYVPIKADMEAFVEDDLLVEPNEVEGEELDVTDILSTISSLEKSQEDILLPRLHPIAVVPDQAQSVRGIRPRFPSPQPLVHVGVVV